MLPGARDANGCGESAQSVARIWERSASRAAVDGWQSAAQSSGSTAATWRASPLARATRTSTEKYAAPTEPSFASPRARYGRAAAQRRSCSTRSPSKTAGSAPAPRPLSARTRAFSAVAARSALAAPAAASAAGPSRAVSAATAEV